MGIVHVFIETMIILENLFRTHHSQYSISPIVLFIKCLVVNHLCTACCVRVDIDLIHLCSAILPFSHIANCLEYWQRYIPLFSKICNGFLSINVRVHSWPDSCTFVPPFDDEALHCNVTLWKNCSSLFPVIGRHTLWSPDYKIAQKHWHSFSLPFTC